MKLLVLANQQAQLVKPRSHASGISVTDLVWTYAGDVDEPEDMRARHRALIRTNKTLLDNVWAGATAEWVFAGREWIPGHGDDDLYWVLDRLDDSTATWDRADGRDHAIAPHI